VLEGRRQLLADERGGGRIEGAEVGVDLLPEAVEQLQDQSALNLELLRQLIDP
jgi:hypothetical protein